MFLRRGLHLKSWIQKNKHKLKPPVGNHLLYGNGQLKVMLCAGPNERNDYHINHGEELFYMVYGSMKLNIVHQQVYDTIDIHQGEWFILPANIPHSPQRLENSYGIVVERERLPKEQDGLVWYAQNQKGTKVSPIDYQEWFYCTDLGSQLVPIIQRYKQWKASNAPSMTSQKDAVSTMNVGEIVQPKMAASIQGEEFKVKLVKGPHMDGEMIHLPTETLLYQLNGESVVRLENGREETLMNGQMKLIHSGSKWTKQSTADSEMMMILNSVV